MNDFIISNHTGGRLANQLYYVLQAFVKSKKMKKSCKYTMSQTECTATDIRIYAKALNIERYVSYNNSHIDEMMPIRHYYQQIGKDFNENDLMAFIEETLSKSHEISIALNENINSHNSVALHVRNGDYAKLPIYQTFDKNDYLKKSISHLPSYVNCIEVFSDDIDLVQKQFSNILENSFAEVSYHVSNENSPLHDFAQLCTYENKIMWNSTFSWWTGFVANSFYPNGVFICPENYFMNEKSYSRTLSNWIHLS